MATTYTLSGPSAIECGGQGTFTVTLDAPHGQAVTVTPADGGRGGSFAPASVAIPAGSTTTSFTYSPRDFGPATVSTASSPALLDPPGVPLVAKIALGSSGTVGTTRCPDLGGFYPSGAWWAELSRDVTGDAVHPQDATIVGQYGAAACKLEMHTSDANGGASYIGMPYNVVPDSQPDLPNTIGFYHNADQPPAVPFFPLMSIEGWFNTTRPPAPGEIKDDHHAMVYERDETTGGARKLHEYNRVETTDGGSTWQSIGGITYDLTTGAPGPDPASSGDAAGLPVVPHLIRYDEVRRGVIPHALRVAVPVGYATNQAAWPARAASAGNVPMYVVPAAALPAGSTALPVRAIRSLVRAGIPNTLLAGTQLTFAYSGVTATLTADVPGGATSVQVAPLSGSVPAGDVATVLLGAAFGQRFRLRQAWYDANRASFLPNVRVVLDALRFKGGINADISGGGFFLNGTNDARWTLAEINQIKTIPVAAFESLALPRRVTFDVPKTVNLGQPVTMTIRHVLPADTKFVDNIYVYHATDPFGAWAYNTPGDAVSGLPAALTPTLRGPYTVRHTPTTPGFHYYRMNANNALWHEDVIAYPVLVVDPNAAPPAPRTLFIGLADGRSLAVSVAG